MGDSWIHSTELEWACYNLHPRSKWVKFSIKGNYLSAILEEPLLDNSKIISTSDEYITIVQCSRWTAVSCLFTHPNVKGPHFFRRAASYGRIKVPQVVKVLTYKELNPIIRTPLLQRNGVPGTPFILRPAQTLIVVGYIYVDGYALTGKNPLYCSQFKQSQQFLFS